MMDWLLVVGAGLIVCFGFVVFFGAPYLPTLKPQARAALELINLKPGETLLELGSGDGKLLKMAAEVGINAVGYELNPILVIVARARTWRYRKYVKVIWGNMWSADWPEADGIFVFLLPKYMKKLDNKVMQWHAGNPKPVRLVSFAFTIPGKQPVGQRKGGVYLYQYK